MEVPRLAVESELQLPAYTTATAIPNLSHICDLQSCLANARSLTHWARPGIEPTSLRTQWWVLNLLSHNRSSSRVVLHFDCTLEREKLLRHTDVLASPRDSDWIGLGCLKTLQHFSWASKVEKHWHSTVLLKLSHLHGPPEDYVKMEAFDSVDLGKPLISFYPFFLFFLFVCFLGPSLWHMEVPRLGVELELQLPAYATTTAMPDPSYICDLQCSSWQCWILNPLSEARIKPAPSWILFGFITC